MRNSNFALRLQASLMEEAKELAKAEGVALNQLINVAVAEKLAAHRTATFLERFTQGANVKSALALLKRERAAEPPVPGDELPTGWTAEKLEKSIIHEHGIGEARKSSTRARRTGQKAHRRG